MMRRIFLPALLIVSLFAIVGIASAAVNLTADESSTTSTTMGGTASTTIDNSPAVGDDATTSTTMGGTASTTIDNSPAVGDDATTSTTMGGTTSTTIDDSDDSDDEFDDDDSTTSTTLDSAATWIEDGVHVIDVSPAGSVTVEVKDNALSLVRVDIAGSWTRTETEMSAREIELKFRDGSTELEVKAEIEDGRLKTRADFETNDDGSDED